MSDGAAIAVAVGLALVVGVLMLSRSKKPIVGTVGGAGYLPNKGSAIAAGIGALASIGGKTIDYFIAKDSNETKLALADKDSDE